MEFKVGSLFDSLSDFEDALEKYSNAEYANFFKKNNVKLARNDEITEAEVRNLHYKRLYLKCKYSAKPQVKSSTRNIRQTSSYKSGCNASITVKYDKWTRKLKIHEMNSDHNHARSANIFECLPKQRALRDEEQKYLSDAVKVSANPRLLQIQFKEKFDKTVTLRDIHNQSARIKAGENKTIDRSVLEEIRHDLNNRKGAVAEFMLSAENTLHSR